MSYAPHPMLDVSREELLNTIVATIREVNPGIMIGDPLPFTGGTVWQGKVVEEFLTHDSEVRLDYPVPAVRRPFVRVGPSQRVKVHLEDLSTFQQFAGMKGWLHPVSASIPHADWLKGKKPGDVVNLNDKNYYASPYTLTEKDFYNHSYATFNFVLSDQ